MLDRTRILIGSGTRLFIGSMGESISYPDITGGKQISPSSVCDDIETSREIRAAAGKYSQRILSAASKGLTSRNYRIYRESLDAESTSDVHKSLMPLRWMCEGLGKVAFPLTVGSLFIAGMWYVKSFGD
jgi:hypothetical protein